MPPLVKGSSARFPISVVAKITGLSIDTLRAWERRHGAVVPSRDERGRMYSDADLRRLTLLRDVVARGHAIGRVATLDEPSLRALVADPDGSAPAAPPAAAGAGVIDVDRLVDALERFDGAGVEADLSRAAAFLQPRALWYEVIAPLLTEIGERWRDGRSRVAHEHLLTASVRSVLGSLLRLHKGTNGAARIALATPSGERHELGTLGAALLAAAGGLHVVYLGPDLPADDIVTLANTVETDAIVLGVTAADDEGRIAETIDSVTRRLPADVELWLGGPAAEPLAQRFPRALALPDFTDLERHLTRLGARL